MNRTLLYKSIKDFFILTLPFFDVLLQIAVKSSRPVPVPWFELKWSAIFLLMLQPEGIDVIVPVQKSSDTW